MRGEVLEVKFGSKAGAGRAWCRLKIYSQGSRNALKGCKSVRDMTSISGPSCCYTESELKGG